ncbi:MAG: endonuclease/exonuclease/phosphatase family protein [Bryobacteraceae bacterium]|nr:endonuclease/exonuclease/phosphatase family protein [Bryobacteraceae bacterium]
MRLLALFAALCLPALAQQTVRVLSYNIHHAEGLDGKIDLPRIAAIIRSVNPDVVALQEVDIRTQRSGGVDQLLELAKLTGMQPVYGRTIPHQGGLYGNAVLSRLPVNGFVNHALPGKEPRGVIQAMFDPLPAASGAAFDFLATHLDLNEPDRLAAAARIKESIAGRPAGRPMVLAGDMNAVPGSKPIEALLKDWNLAQGAQPLLTSPSANPRRQIDYIFVRPASRWRVVETRVLDEPVASDHRPLFAVLELLPESGSPAP